MPPALEGLVQPFSAPALTGTGPLAAAAIPGGGASYTGVIALLWLMGLVMVMGAWMLRWRRVSAAVRTARPITNGAVHDALRRLERASGISRRVALVSSTEPIEPGVFGVWTPVLLWPRGIDQHLDQAQVDAILAHEIAHIRRRDNLAAVVHMCVQALFWFHPLVWWLGARLVDERERACDEDVIRMGSDRAVYAEGVLRTCRLYVESPLTCVAGVTGSSLTRRIELIMRNDVNAGLTMSKRILLAAAAVAATIGPVVVGVLTAPRLAAQVVAPTAESPVFEAASIRPSPPGGRMGGRGTPGRFVGTGLPLRRLIAGEPAGHHLVQSDCPESDGPGRRLRFRLQVDERVRSRPRRPASWTATGSGTKGRTHARHRPSRATRLATGCTTGHRRSPDRRFSRKADGELTPC